MENKENKKNGYNLKLKLYNEVLNDLKKKNKGMFKCLNNAGDKYKKAIYYYMKRIIRDEDIPKGFNLTWLIAIWKKKGSALDLNQMRYIHTKLWDAKLCEAIVTKHMKPKIIAACLNIHSRNPQGFKCQAFGNHEDIDEDKRRYQGRRNNPELLHGEVLR